MNDILYLARSRATVVWLVLVGATAVSWWLGVHDAAGPDRNGGAVGALVLLIAMIKVRLVALYFMEIRDAPRPLRLIIEFYCAAVLTALTVPLFVT